MPRHGLTKEHVTAAAVRLAERDGYDNLTLHKLAAELDVRTASLYTHIAGIEELRSLLSKWALYQLEGALRSAVVGRNRDDAIRALAEAYYDFAREHRQMYTAIMRVPLSNDEQLIDAGRRAKAILFAQLDRFRLSSKRALLMSRQFHSLLHGFVTLEDAGFFDPVHGIKESLDAIVDSFIRQLHDLEHDEEY